MSMYPTLRTARGIVSDGCGIFQGLQQTRMSLRLGGKLCNLLVLSQGSRILFKLETVEGILCLLNLNNVFSFDKSNLASDHDSIRRRS